MNFCPCAHPAKLITLTTISTISIALFQEAEQAAFLIWWATRPTPSASNAAKCWLRLCKPTKPEIPRKKTIRTWADRWVQFQFLACSYIARKFEHVRIGGFLNGKSWGLLVNADTLIKTYRDTFCYSSTLPCFLVCRSRMPFLSTLVTRAWSTRIACVREFSISKILKIRCSGMGESAIIIFMPLGFTP